jgi:hypothetical protein
MRLVLDKKKKNLLLSMIELPAIILATAIPTSVYLILRKYEYINTADGVSVAMIIFLGNILGLMAILYINYIRAKIDK